MNDNVTSSQQATPATPPKRIRFRRATTLIIALLLAYLIGAYALIPALWMRYAHRHPAFDDVPRLTLTGDDHPGGPINVALIGTETELKKIMVANNWYPADQLPLHSYL